MSLSFMFLQCSRHVQTFGSHKLKCAAPSTCSCLRMHGMLKCLTLTSHANDWCLHRVLIGFDLCVASGAP